MPLLISSLLPLGRGPSLGCRAEIRTRACHTASRCATAWVTPHLKATPHPNVTPHPSVIGRCSLVPTSHWPQGKCTRINFSQATSCVILQNHRRASWKHFECRNRCRRVFEAGYHGRIFKISKTFQRSKLKFWVWFSHELRNKKLLKLSALVQKVTYYYY